MLFPKAQLFLPVVNANTGIVRLDCTGISGDTFRLEASACTAADADELMGEESRHTVAAVRVFSVTTIDDGCGG